MKQDILYIRSLIFKFSNYPILKLTYGLAQNSRKRSGTTLAG